MIIHRGTSLKEAIKVKTNPHDSSYAESLIEHYLDELFGLEDGAYFIHSSAIHQIQNYRKFRVMLIEDKDTIKHQIFFEYVTS